MKKVILIIVIVSIILAVIAGLIATAAVVIISNQTGTTTTTTGENPSKTPVSEITLNTKQYINQLENVKIKDTNDTVMITKQVKFAVPDYGEGVTVSFAIAIPYTITVDGKEYPGTYLLGSSNSKSDDSNPKYDFEVTNLTKDGDIQVLVKSK